MSAKMSDSLERISLDRLRDVLEYNKETGLFTWRKKTSLSSRIEIGSRAGTVTKRGYRHIIVDGRTYRASRLAWFYVVGAWPEKQIDHKNGNHDDDRYGNLREATPPQNMANRTKLRTMRGKKPSSPLKWVTFYKPRGNWVSRLQVRHRYIHLGYFDCPAAAHFAAAIAADKLHGAFARAS